MELIVCDDEDKLKLLLKWGKEKLPNVKTIVHMNAVSEETTKAVEEQGWRILSFADMEVCICTKEFMVGRRRF